MTPPPTRTVVIEKRIASRAGKNLASSLTDGALMKEWLMDNDFQPVVGHPFNFRATPLPQWNGLIDSEVLVVEPNKKISFRWNALGLESVVVFTLVSITRGTLLRMEQSGFRPDQTAAYNGANHGWQKFIANLERLVASLQE